MNPLIKTVFSADPSAHVWEDKNTMWIYASHDEVMTNTHDNMQSYHVFSSEDMVNWKDYGCVLSLENVDWAVSHMWAIDAVYRHGMYYLIFCAMEEATGMFRTGIATSKLPQGPFKNEGFIKGVEWGQDPTLFVDEDDTPYLFWGLGAACYVCELKDDLREAVPGTQVELTDQLKWVFEGPWVHKYQEKYYLSYPGLYEDQWPEHMYYATADKPLGPYTYRGEYIPLFEGHSGTNHGSIVLFKGKWYGFHHSAWISGISESRNIMCDYIEHNEDGTIKPIIPNEQGVHSTENQDYETKVTIILDAAGAPMMRGKLSGTKIGTQIPNFTGMGYVENFANRHYGVTVMAQSCVERYCDLKVRYCAPDGNCTKKVMFNNTMLRPANADPEVYDKLYEFEQCNDWREVTIERVKLNAGENYIRFYNGEGEIKVDCIMLEQCQE